MRSESLDSWIRALNAALADKTRELEGGRTVVFFDADVVIDGAFVSQQIKSDFAKTDQSNQSLKRTVHKSTSTRASIAASYWAMGYLGKVFLLPPHAIEIEHYLEKELPALSMQEMQRILGLMDIDELASLLQDSDSESLPVSSSRGARYEHLAGSTFVMLQALSGIGDGSPDLTLSSLLDFTYVNAQVENEMSRILHNDITRGLWTQIHMRRPYRRRHLNLLRRSIGRSAGGNTTEESASVVDTSKNELSDASALAQIAVWMRREEHRNTLFRFFTNTSAVITGASADREWRAVARDGTPAPYSPMDFSTALDDPDGPLRSGRYLVWRSLFSSLSLAKGPLFPEGPTARSLVEHGQSTPGWSIEDLAYLVDSYRNIQQRFGGSEISTIYTSLTEHHRWLFSNLDQARRCQHVAKIWLQTSAPLHQGLVRFVNQVTNNDESCAALSAFLHNVERRKGALTERVKARIGELSGRLRSKLIAFASLCDTIGYSSLELSEPGGLLFANQSEMDRWLVMSTEHSAIVAVEARELWLRLVVSSEGKAIDEEDVVGQLPNSRPECVPHLMARFAAADEPGMQRVLERYPASNLSDVRTPQELAYCMLAAASHCVLAACKKCDPLGIDYIRRLDAIWQQVCIHAGLRRQGAEAFGWVVFYWWMAEAELDGEFHPIATELDHIVLLTNALNNISPLAKYDNMTVVPDVCWLLAASIGDWARFGIPQPSSVNELSRKHRSQAIAWYCVLHTISATEQSDKGPVQERKERARPWFEIQQRRGVPGIKEKYWERVERFYNEWS